MTRKPNEQADVALVKRIIFGGQGLLLEPFAREETLKNRTPDFKVFKNSKIVAFCEIKSPRDDWLDAQIETANPGQIAGGARNDPTFNRLARHISKAASQFDAVNKDRAVPNILVFVKSDPLQTRTNYQDRPGRVGHVSALVDERPQATLTGPLPKRRLQAAL
jgi:hypothetical protein